MDKGTGVIKKIGEREKRGMEAWHCCCEGVPRGLAEGVEEEDAGFWRSCQGWRQHLCYGLRPCNWVILLGSDQQIQKGEAGGWSHHRAPGKRGKRGEVREDG